MTTTLPSMAQTIEQLHTADLPCKVMVGGAVLTGLCQGDRGGLLCRMPSSGVPMWPSRCWVPDEVLHGETPCDTAKASKKEPVRNFMRTGSFVCRVQNGFRTWGMIGCLFDFFFHTARTVRAPLHRSSPLQGCHPHRCPESLTETFPSSGKAVGGQRHLKAALNKMQKYCIHGQAASGGIIRQAAAVMVSDCALMMRWAASSLQLMGEVAVAHVQNHSGRACLGTDGIKAESPSSLQVVGGVSVQHGAANFCHHAGGFRFAEDLPAG